METPRKFIIAIINYYAIINNKLLCNNNYYAIINNYAIINLRGVSTKLNKYIVFTMQTYKKLTIFYDTAPYLMYK